MKHGEPRNSGATLWDVVMKTGDGMVNQSLEMQAHPDVYVPVLAVTDDGYIMPKFEELSNAHDVQAALLLLRGLWATAEATQRGFNTGGALVARQHYNAYVLSLDCHPRVLHCVQMWFRKTREVAGTPALALHGDATLENAMKLHGVVRWIDPNYKTPVPQEVEVDIGKLLQSLYGYHALPAHASVVIRNFLQYDIAHTRALGMYYFTTHLARLWRYQPQKHEWVLKTVEEVIDAVPRV